MLIRGPFCRPEVYVEESGGTFIPCAVCFALLCCVYYCSHKTSLSSSFLLPLYSFLLYSFLLTIPSFLLPPSSSFLLPPSSFLLKGSWVLWAMGKKIGDNITIVDKNPKEMATIGAAGAKTIKGAKKHNEKQQALGKADNEDVAPASGGKAAVQVVRTKLFFLI